MARILLVLVALAEAANAQNDPKVAKPEAQTAVQSGLDDAAVIARLLFDRYRVTAAEATEVSGDRRALEGSTPLSADHKRRIERNSFQAFVWRNFEYNRPSVVYLRSAGRRGEIFLAKFDRAGKMISCETDSSPSAGHYASDHHVSVFKVADELRRCKRLNELDDAIEIVFDRTAIVERGLTPPALRNEKRDGEFVIARKNDVPWCRGRFEGDLPVGEWQLYDSEGKLTERWEFPVGKIKKTPNVPTEPFAYEGDLGAHDFSLTLIQGNARSGDGPPQTTVRISAGGNCETEFGSWKASFRLTNEMQRSLRDLVRLIDVPSLKSTYDNPHVEDGGWMTVSLRINGVSKTVRYINWYPRPIRDLTNFFVADVMPQYPIEFLAAFKCNSPNIRGSQTFLDDER